MKTALKSQKITKTGPKTTKTSFWCSNIIKRPFLPSILFSFVPDRFQRWIRFNEVEYPMAFLFYEDIHVGVIASWEERDKAEWTVGRRVNYGSLVAPIVGNTEVPPRRTGCPSGWALTGWQALICPDGRPGMVRRFWRRVIFRPRGNGRESRWPDGMWQSRRLSK